jgi:hypothetical protein
MSMELAEWLSVGRICSLMMWFAMSSKENARMFTTLIAAVAATLYALLAVVATCYGKLDAPFWANVALCVSLVLVASYLWGWIAVQFVRFQREERASTPI